MKQFTIMLVMAAALIWGMPQLEDPKLVALAAPCAAEAREELRRVLPGMTRARLLEVMTTEGGLSTGLQRTYISRTCPYVKVRVVFEAVGRPARDAEGRVTLVEDSRDIIRSMSEPFLGYMVAD